MAVQFNTTPGGSAAAGPTNGGKVIAVNNLTTSPVQVIAGNPSRQSITFHNPGSVDIFVAPTQQIVAGSSVTLTPSTGALGGCYRVFSNGGEKTFIGECQSAWQAFAASASGNPLTISESNT